MKKFILLAAFAAFAMPQSAQADILIAGWDAFDSGLTPSTPYQDANVTATMLNNVSAVRFSNGASEDRGSSSDTTWGSFAGAGNPASSVIVGNVNLTAHNGETGDQSQITITNNHATDNLELDFLHFDALAFRPNAARTFAIDRDGSNVFTSAAQVITSLGTAPNAAQDQHDEFDIDISGAPIVPGGSVVLLATFTGGTGGSGHHLWVDNVAVSGQFVSAIPEPSSLALLGLAGMGTLVRRRK